jgi:hypothetical protein
LDHERAAALGGVLASMHGPQWRGSRRQYRDRVWLILVLWADDLFEAG